MKNLHHHRCWTNLWHHDRENVLRVWSRTQLEGRNQRWTARDVLPAIVVKGEFSRGDSDTWTQEVRALWEALIWKSY